MVKITVDGITFNVRNKVKEKLDELFVLANLMGYEIREDTMGLGGSELKSNKFKVEVPYYRLYGKDIYSIMFVLCKSGKVQGISSNKNDNEKIFHKDNDNTEWSIDETIKEMG